MKLSIPADLKNQVMNDLQKANNLFQEIYPGDSPERQPVHTVYGGANLFKSDTIEKMGKAAVKSFQTYAGNFIIFSRALRLSGWESFQELNPQEYELKLNKLSPEERKYEATWLPFAIYNKVLKKLESEAIEDFRIDFEDGYGNRPDDEEDATAVSAAVELANSMKLGNGSPFIGIRIKPFTEELKNRGSRTMDIFITTLLENSGGKLPGNFIITLPKVTIPEQVTALVRLLEILENNTGLKKNTLKMEIMIETSQSVIGAEGTNPMLAMIRAGNGRIRGAHFGTYDYTASSNITAAYQKMDHQVCDFAHHMMKVALGGTGIWLSDGATNVMPVGPHRGQELTPGQLKENIDTVHRAWKLAYDHTRHSLWKGLYQGWDLHPAQLAVRYAAVYAFFLESYDEAALRLKNFMLKAGQATLSGDVFDDAATGQGLLNYFLSALNCGAVTEDEVTVTGLTIEEIRTRSFSKILDGRRNRVKA